MKAEKKGKVEPQTEEVMVKDVSTITEIELNTLKDFNKTFGQITVELGNLELSKLEIESRKEKVLDVFKETQAQSNQFATKLKEKYGDINIDLNTGDFVLVEQ